MHQCNFSRLRILLLSLAGYSIPFYDGVYGPASNSSLVLENELFPYCNGDEDNLFSCKMFFPKDEFNFGCKYQFGMSCTPQVEGKSLTLSDDHHN